VSPGAEREFDVVVFGATSVTGRRTCAYLAGLDGGASWAAAGRDLTKVQRVLAEEGVSAPATIAADIDDPTSLREMADRARTLVNVVGPYTRYGEPVIEACVEGEAHYVDLTGEMPFARRMLDRFAAAARDAGVKIVQTCGFESLPPDLLVMLAAEAARERFDEGLAEIELEVAVTGTPPGMPRPTDMLSGGTMQSMAEVTRDPDAERITDPGVLITDPEAAAAVARVSPIKVAPRRGFSGAVLAPMSPAAFINPAVIHRSAAIAADDRGEDFRPFVYREGVVIPGPAPTLPLRYAAAGALSAIQAGIARAARSQPATRERIGSRMGKLFPDSGFGPAADRLEAWRWRMSVQATTTGGHVVSAEADADGHPGYLATSRMMGEAGLLLAEPGATPERAGYLTPATALGTGSVERFARAGLRFSVA
jgi:short subunit dehydrogenase-like uncharacterized protein